MKTQPTKSNWPDDFIYNYGSCIQSGGILYQYFPRVIICSNQHNITYAFKLKSWKN